MRPRLLDLFCGAGGASVGYHRAGFDVTGVDIEDHPSYPFDLVVGEWDSVAFELFDVVAASPPCQAYSITRHIHSAVHPDLLVPVRDALVAWGGLYIIENVPGAPLVDPVLVCGRAMGLPRLKRHRLFESNLPLMSPGCACSYEKPVGVYGSMNDHVPDGGTTAADIVEAREVMGIDWFRWRSLTQEWRDLTQAVPPAYTEYLGAQALDLLGVAHACTD